MLKLSTTTWDESDYEALNRVIASGMFTMGAEVASFERDFAKYFRVKYAVMVNSGSSANLLAAFALKYHSKYSISLNDEVIVPAVSWSTTYYPFSQAGFKLVFVDIDSDYNISVEAVIEAITDKTKVIVAVNLLGSAAELYKLKQICDERSIILFEDNCESMGALIQGAYAGTIGLCGTFSSYFSHHINTIEGGIITTDDEELYLLLLSMRSHGWTRNWPDKNILHEKTGNYIEDTFDFVLPGFNLRPMEFQGALGISQLKKLPEILIGRRNNAEIFHKHLSAISNGKITTHSWSVDNSFFGFPLVFESEAKRRLFIDYLETKGVEYRPIVTGNFTEKKVVKLLNHRISGDLANARHIDKCGLFIGNHHYDISKELTDILTNIPDSILND